MNNPFDLLNTEPKLIGPGIYFDISNEDYHSGPGISKSGLDLINQCPSLYQWSKNAPRDSERTEAVDFGTALHAWLLEPDEFASRYIVAPDFDRRTNIGKADEAEFLEEARQQGKIAIQSDDYRKLSIMRDSVMAHPVAKLLFDIEGSNEASIYWTDSETGELCRIRPDRMVNINGRPTIVDLKKIEGIDRMRRHVNEFRYHVQDAMYCEGYEAHFNQRPDFWFLFVSSSASAGAYKVGVFQLSHEYKLEGYESYRRNLNLYHHCNKNNDWLHIQPID